MKKLMKDHISSLTREGSSAVSRRMELMDITETLSSSENRRALFAESTGEDFLNIVGYVNRVSRGMSVKSRATENGKLPMLDTPSEEDKPVLMEKTAEALRYIAKNQDLTDDESLELIGLTMAGALNLIHPYMDGNGRTGRILDYLARFGSEREAIDYEIRAVIEKQLDPLKLRKPIYDTPPAEMERALNSVVHQINPELQGEQLASARVVAFLDMMTGLIDVPLQEQGKFVTGSTTEGTKLRHVYPVGFSARQLYIECTRMNSALIDAPIAVKQ